MFKEILHKLSFHLTLLLVVVISIVSTLLAIPIFLLFLLYRLFVWIIVKSIRRDLHSFVSDLNVNFASEIPGNSLCNIMMCFVVQGEISSERLCQLFEERVINLKNSEGKLIYKRLQQSWTHFMGYSFWKNDKEFSLANHVRDYDYTGELLLPTNCKEEDLRKVWPKLAEAPWKFNLSPWEALVVGNYEKSGKAHTLIIFRVDHIHCDVYSLIGLFRILFQSPFTTPKPARNDRVLSMWERLKVVLTLPYEMTEVFQLLFKGRRLGARVNSNRQNTYCSVSSNISVNVIKSIKKMHNVEFATVVHSAVHGAVARALIHSGKKPPAKLDLAYVLPLANHPGGWNLHATMVVAELPCQAESSKERLYETEKILKKFDRALVPISSVYFGRVFALIPSRIIRAYFLFVLKFGPSFGMSNFPTILSKEHVDGLEIVDVFTALTSSQSLGMVISSWGVNSQQRFNFFLDKTIFGAEESATKIATFFEEELEALQTMEYPVIQK